MLLTLGAARCNAIEAIMLGPSNIFGKGIRKLEELFFLSAVWCATLFSYPLGIGNVP